jgi:hypothetical protein
VGGAHIVLRKTRWPKAFAPYRWCRGEAVLWRSCSDGYAATAFNATPRPRRPAGAPVLGERFDSADGSYGYTRLSGSTGAPDGGPLPAALPW